MPSLTQPWRKPSSFLRSCSIPSSFLSLTSIALFFLFFTTPSIAFYLPGIAPVDYEEGAPLEVLANKLTSSKHKIPFDYYSIPHCGSETKVKSKPLNIGQILVGESAKPTTFELRMLITESCRLQCKKTLTKKDAKKISKRIIQGYNVRINLDNMPAVVRGTSRSGAAAYQFGYSLGVKDESTMDTFLNNHLKLKILYHKSSTLPSDVSLSDMHMVYRVVGFEVEAFSVQHSVKKNGEELDGKTCPLTVDIKPLLVEPNVTVYYTYDVAFEESDIAWATRWDPLLNANQELKQIQWFSIINSLMIGVFLTALVGTIMLRTILRDFVRYNKLEEADDTDDITGWKLVHGDVFRPPENAALLAVLYGSGAQIFWMTLVTLLFAMAGFLSPANRGGLLTSVLILWVLASTIAGYASARLYSSLEGNEKRKYVTLGAAFFFPGIAFTVFFILNLLLLFSRSSGSVPFLTLVLLLFMWFGISVPLVFLGSYLGYKRKPYEYPVRTNQIPRQIPPPPFEIPASAYILIAGILPFGTVFMELVFILNSLWQNQVYYMFGFLFLVFCLLIITCAEMSIVFTYLTLSNENYKWWWQAFLSSGSSGLYVYLYSIYYLFTQPGLDGMTVVSKFIYLGYMAVISIAFFLLTSCIGFFSSFLFVRKIYASIRAE